LFLLATAGCLPAQDPASYLNGLRVLAIKAEPPDLAPGASTTLTALALDTQGRMLDIGWAACLRPPLQGQIVHPDCVTNETADYLQPIGSGPSVMATMPRVDPTSRAFGLPDSTGGLYLPVRVRAVAGGDTLAAVYRLRLLTRPPANQNPVIDQIFQVTPAVEGGPSEMLTPLDPMTSPIVHSGQEITLRAALAASSAETYSIYDGPPETTPPRSATERLTVSFFATAGSLSTAQTGAERPDAVLKLDTHLPASGMAIEIYVVARDERGGMDYQRRTLRLE
jgi:hypothetical protein